MNLLRELDTMQISLILRGGIGMIQNGELFSFQEPSHHLQTLLTSKSLLINDKQLRSHKHQPETGKEWVSFKNPKYPE